MPQSPAEKLVEQIKDGSMVFHRLEIKPGKEVQWVTAAGVTEIPDFVKVAIEEAKKETPIEERVLTAVPWRTDMPWAKELNIKASTYTPYDLFPEVPTCPYSNGPGDSPEDTKYFASSPDGKWRYLKMMTSPGMLFPTWYGKETGTLLFDGNAAIPTLARLNDAGKWFVFMNVTPAEGLSLRPGTQLAKGHTIVGGLGLGYHLIDIARKKGVKKVTVVEKSGTLINWLRPRIEKIIEEKRERTLSSLLFPSQRAVKIEWIEGDVFEVLPKLKADVAVVDIAPTYASVDADLHRLENTCPLIDKIWCWGINSAPALRAV